MKVQIGKVTTARRGRLHLDIDGRARCGSGLGRIRSLTLTLTRRDPRPVDEPLMCRRCLPYLRAAIAEAQAEAVAAASNRYSESEVQRLVCLADAFEDTDEQAAMNELAARVAATMEHAAEVMAQPEPQRRRTWADLRREFAETHQPTLFAA